MWDVIRTVDGTLHIVPVDDLKPHGRLRCWCKPTEDAGDGIWVHHALDQRERKEMRGCDDA